MALQYVGGTSGTGTGSSYTISLNGTLTGGIGTSPQTGDTIVVYVGQATPGTQAAPSASGNSSGTFATFGSALTATDTWGTQFQVFYRARVGLTPDTSVTITRANNTTHGGAAVVQVWRGARNVVTPFGAPINATGINGAALNPPSRTPLAGQFMISGGAGTMPAAGTSGYTSITGLSNTVTAYGNGSTADLSIIMASVEGTGALFDPPVATGGTQNNASSSWVGFSVVLLPQPDPTSGNMAAIETGADTASAQGGVRLAGALTATESGIDSLQAAGTVTTPAVPVTGEMAAVESGQDSLAASAQVAVRGNFVAVEPGQDGLAATGQVVVRCNIAAMEAADGAAGAGQVRVQGDLALTEARDTFAAAGLAPAQITGILAVTEGSDVFEFAGIVLNTGTLAATEARDVFRAESEKPAILGSDQYQSIAARVFAMQVHGDGAGVFLRIGRRRGTR